MQTINSVPSPRQASAFILINSSTFRKQKQMKPISLHYLTGLMKKVAYIFHGSGDSFNMIFITINQPKIHKHLYFKLFFTSKYFLSEHNFKKQLHIFYLRYYATFNFRKTQNLFGSYKVTSNSVLFQYHQKKMRILQWNDMLLFEFILLSTML